jgi:hypothetical protein
MGGTTIHRENVQFLGAVSFGPPSAPASDAAVALSSSSTHVSLTSASGAKAITTTTGIGAPVEGQTVTLYMATLSGGSYTLALAAGTLTLDAAREAATVRRVGSTWVAVSLAGATIV